MGSIKSNLYYSQMAQQGNFDWLYNRPVAFNQPSNAMGNMPQFNQMAGAGSQVNNPSIPQVNQMAGMGLPINNPSIPQNVPPPYDYQYQNGDPRMGASDYMQLAGYIPQIAGDVAMAFKAPEYDTKVQGGDWSGYNPVHGLGEDIQRAHAINTDNWIKQSIGQNTMKFAGTGAQIGTSILPGIGTAIGAGVGAISGFFTGLFGGKKKKRKAEEQRDLILSRVAEQAEQFSDVNIKAKQEQQAKRIALQNL